MKALQLFVSTGVALAVLLSAAVAGAQAPPRISLEEALRLIDAAQQDAAARKLSLSFAVVDARGDVIALVRMPGAGAGTTDTAIGKAMLSAFFGQPSAAFTARANSALMLGMNDTVGGRFRFFQGALPIVRSGMMVGAIAASGATSQLDEDTVKAALSAVPLQ